MPEKVEQSALGTGNLHRYNLFFMLGLEFPSTRSLNCFCWMVDRSTGLTPHSSHQPKVSMWLYLGRYTYEALLDRKGSCVSIRGVATFEHRRDIGVHASGDAILTVGCQYPTSLNNLSVGPACSCGRYATLESIARPGAILFDSGVVVGVSRAELMVQRRRHTNAGLMPMTK